MSEIEIFVQGEGIPEIILLRVLGNGTVQDILRSASAQGVRFAEDERSLVILIEDQETELSPIFRLRRPISATGAVYMSIVATGWRSPSTSTPLT